MAHSKYRFRWEGTIEKNGITCPLFSLTSSTGMIWRGYFSDKDDAVRFLDNEEKSLSVEFEFIGTSKLESIPLKGRTHLAYKLNRFVLNTIMRELKDLRLKDMLRHEKL